MSIIILCGSDCSGKSTFAEQLSKKTGYKIVKGSSFEIAELGADGMFEHMMSLLDGDNIIIDRFAWCNLVYGSLFDYPMMTEEQFDTIVDKVDEKNAIVLYLHAPLGVLKYRMKNRGDDIIKVENLNSIVEKYEEEMYGNYRPNMFISIDTSQDTKNALNTVKKLVKKK